MQFTLLAFVVAAVAPLSALAAPTQITSTIGLPTTLSVSKIPTLTTLSGSSITVSSRTTTVVPTSTSTPTPVPSSGDNGACDRLAAQCKIEDASSPLGAYRTAFNKLSCVLAFACRAGGAGLAGGVPRNVDDVIYLEFWNSKAVPPKATELPRLSVNIFNQHSTGGVWSEQNFIDTYYGKLSELGGPYPTDVEVVKGYWANIAAWTGFCRTKVERRGVPYNNLADWYTYSSTVQPGAEVSC